MLFSAYPSILPAASWPPAGKAGGCSDERGSIQKCKKETQFAERHSSSLCFSGTARAPAAKLLLIVLSVIPPKTVKVSAESFLFPIFFFRRMGALVPLQSPFLPNLLRPNLLRPRDASRQADISCPVHRETPNTRLL